MKNDDRVKRVKTLQSKVLETILSPEEFKALMNKYAENSGRTGVFQRKKYLNKPVLPSEKDAMRQYLKFVSQRKVSEILGGRTTRDGIGRISLRWIFQNKEVLDKALKEGENE